MLGYRFSGSAIAYPEEFNAINFTNGQRIPRLPEVRHTVTETGNISSRDLVIVNETVTPNPFFPSDEEPEAKLTAQVVPVGPDLGSAPDIEWTVSLVDEEGTVIWPQLASGTGPFVSAVWDGTDVNGNPIDPQTVHFRIQAQGCPGGDEEPPPPAFRGQELLFQDAAGSCRTEEKLVAVDVRTGSDFLVVSADPASIPPSDLPYGHDNPSRATVEIELLRMPQDATEVVVTLSVDVVDDAAFPGNGPDAELNLQLQGGHNHAGRPAADLDQTEFIFTAPGKRHTTFTATAAGGVERLKAIAQGHPEIPPATATLDIKVPGLISLQEMDGVTEVIEFQAPTTTHPLPYFATNQVGGAVLAIARQFRTKYGERFFVNDMSLLRGGLGHQQRLAARNGVTPITLDDKPDEGGSVHT